MWFYKIDGVLDGFTFPEDRRIRSQAAQEFQPKQTLFSKKLQSKCYITVSQIKGGRITLAAVSLESYNILARCREFLREAEVPVKNLIAQEITYDVLRSLLQAAERWGFLEDDRDVYNLFHLEELQHNIYDFQEFSAPGASRLGEQKRRPPGFLSRTPLTQSWSASTRGLPCWWRADTPSTTYWCAMREKPGTSRWSCCFRPCTKTAGSAANGTPTWILTAMRGWMTAC